MTSYLLKDLLENANTEGGGSYRVSRISFSKKDATTKEKFHSEIPNYLQAAEHDERSFTSTGVRKQGLDPTQEEPQESNLTTSKSSNFRLFYLTYLLYRMYFK